MQLDNVWLSSKSWFFYSFSLHFYKNIFFIQWLGFINSLLFYCHIGTMKVGSFEFYWGLIRIGTGLRQIFSLTFRNYNQHNYLSDVRCNHSCFPY